MHGITMLKCQCFKCTMKCASIQMLLGACLAASLASQIVAYIRKGNPKTAAKVCILRYVLVYKNVIWLKLKML